MSEFFSSFDDDDDDETIPILSLSFSPLPFSPSHVAQAASAPATTAVASSPPRAAMNGVATAASQEKPEPKLLLRSSSLGHREAATPTAAANAAAQSSWKQATGKASRGMSSVPMAQRLPKRRMAGMVLRVEWLVGERRDDRRRNVETSIETEKKMILFAPCCKAFFLFPSRSA